MDSQSNRSFLEPMDESAEIALKYSQMLGAIPVTFGSAVRSLMSDFYGGKKMGSQSEFQVNRLLRAPTVLACFYFATRTFYSDHFVEGTTHSPLELARLYDPYSLAAILGNIYLYKRCRRICHRDEWRFVAEPYQRNVEAAGRLGVNCKTVGLGHSVIGASVLFGAFATFLAHDPKGFVDYRRHLKKMDVDFDSEYELSQWGCTSVQVASNILVAMGYGVRVAHAFFHGMNYPSAHRPPREAPGRPIWYVRRWLTGLQSQVNAGMLPNNDLVPIDDSAREVLLAEFVELFETGSKYRWLDRGKPDANPLDIPDVVLPAAIDDDGDSQEEASADEELPT